MTSWFGAGLGAFERRRAAAAFLTVFGLAVAHALLETARDALFLARLPASQLPWAYLAIAVAAAGLSRVSWPSGRSSLGRRGLSLILLATAAVTAALWALEPAGDPWKLRALYVWTGVNATVTGLQLWLILGGFWTVREAKGAFTALTVGGLVGGVVGAAAARALLTVSPPAGLLLASAGAQALTAVGPALLLSPGGRALARPRSPLASSMRLLREHRYARGLASLALLSTMALTAADFVFKSGVARAVPAGELGAFFAGTYTALNALALGTQLFVAGWLLRVLGLTRAQAVLPGLFLLGSAGFVAGGALVAALFLKAADGAFRDVHRSTSELLLVPLPDELRSRVKPVLDVAARRGGQALASLGILAAMSLPRPETWVAAGCAALSLAWIDRARALRQGYLDLFRSALREGRLRGGGELPALDVPAFEAVLAALGSGDDTEVIGAMDVLAGGGHVRLIPTLVLYHPSEAVALRALELFERGGRRDFVGAADRLRHHASPRLRAAALRARTAAAPDRDVLRAAAADPSPVVRAAACVALVSLGEDPMDAAPVLEELLADPDPEVRRELARAVAQRPSPAFEELLERLARGSEPAVLAEVARAMGTLRSERFLPVLLRLLATGEVRGPAREALLRFGERGLSFVAAALADPSLPHEVRRHLPRTISRFPAEAAAPVLLSRILVEPDGMVRFRILRGLGRLAADHPALPLDRELLRQAMERTLEVAFRLIHWRVVLLEGAVEEPRRATASHDLLVALLRDKERHAVERLFRLLALELRGENLRDVHRGLANTSPELRASSLELLEHLLPPALREPVLALVDDLPDAVRLARAGAHHRVGALGYEGLLAVLLDSPGDALRSLAVHHIGELGLRDLREKIERLQMEHPAGVLERAIARALRRLSGTGEGLADAR